MLLVPVLNVESILTLGLQRFPNTLVAVIGIAFITKGPDKQALNFDGQAFKGERLGFIT